MVAYKIWYDIKHFIHKDTTNELDVSWTTNIDDAKKVLNYSEAVNFFHDNLGFSLNISRRNALYYM